MCGLVLLGTRWERPALQVAGVLAGFATGGLLYWWGGRVAAGAWPTAGPG